MELFHGLSINHVGFDIKIKIQTSRRNLDLLESRTIYNV